MAGRNLRPPAGEPLARGSTLLPTTAWMSYFQDVADRLAALDTAATGPSYANDAAAAAGGVDLHGWYRNGSALMTRVV